MRKEKILLQLLFCATRAVADAIPRQYPSAFARSLWIGGKTYNRASLLPREFFCLSQWLGAYAFYPQHIAFGPLVQCGSFPQGAAVFIADRIMLEGKRFWLLLLPALELVSFFCVCECRKLEQRSPPSLVPLVSMPALVFVEGAN